MSSTVSSGQLLNYLTTGNVANFTMVVPAAQQIVAIQMRETAAHAVTGGIRVGTTDGGAEVITAQAVGSGANLVVADAAILLKVFSTTVDTTLYFQAVTNWNSASLNVALLTGPAV